MSGEKRPLPHLFLVLLFCFFQREEAQLEPHEVPAVRELYCLQESHPSFPALGAPASIRRGIPERTRMQVSAPCTFSVAPVFSPAEDRMALAQSILCLAALQNGAEREKQRSQGCMSAVGLGASMPPFPPRRKHGGCFEFRHNTLNNLLLCCHLLTTPLAGHNQWRERKLWCHKSWVTLPNGISKNMSS